jgi:omega-6 fatty acid desaturase (delta-12 desaturase)
MSAAAMVEETATTDAPRAPWRPAVAKYAQPHLGRTLLDLATSVVPYLALMVGMYYAIDVSLLLTIALAPLAAGFLLRTFILFHDCTHGSLFHNKRANRWLGTFLGLLVYTPFESWGHSHAVHHATAGDLDRRGVGDVTTLTVDEYLAKSAGGQLAYRLFRNPLVMFGLGPILSVVVIPRLVPKDARPRLRRAVIRTNIVVAVVVTGLVLTMGWWQYLVVQWPTAWMAASAGIWLFYVQHQFEDVYWENNENWEFADAAIRGSSFLKLPRILQYFTGNIGFHHVHHLSARIPNYNLQRAHEEIDLFRNVPVLTLSDGLRATRLKLWCEKTGRLVTFAEARAAVAAA